MGKLGKPMVYWTYEILLFSGFARKEVTRLRAREGNVDVSTHKTGNVDVSTQN